MGRKLSVIRNPKNLKPGMRFNRLTILERVSKDHEKNPYKYAAWKCKCDCGNITYASTHDLMQEKVKSCGCLKSEISGKYIGKLVSLIKEGKIKPGAHAIKVKKCSECGKLFTGRVNKLTCSPECAKERTKRLNKENHRKQYKKFYKSTKVYCLKCGKKIPINKEYCEKCSKELSKLGIDSYTVNKTSTKR